MKKTLCALLAALLLLTCVPALAAETVVHPLGTSGAVTVGIRGSQLVYTYDGVNWSKGTVDGTAPASLWWGYWNGSEFLAFSEPGNVCPVLRSKDGVKWTAIPAGTKEDFSYLPRNRVDVGKYRFELDGDGELWLVSPAAHQGVQLPDVGASARKRGVRYTDIQAYPVPKGVCVVAFVNRRDTVEDRYVTVYPTSSLEWVLEHQGEYWGSGTVEGDPVSSGTVRVRLVRVGAYGSYLEYAPVGSDAWTAVPKAPWNGNHGWSVSLLPYNGKTFVAQDILSMRLYTSQDGISWRSLEGTFLAAEREQSCDYYPAGIARPTIESSPKLVWTGAGYLSCRQAIQHRYGMMGTWGGEWYSPYNTKVCFADEALKLLWTYDFGRQVERVGFANGVYYAEVWETKALSSDERGRAQGALGYPAQMPSVIYKSTDGKSWAATDLAQVFTSLHSGG